MVRPRSEETATSKVAGGSALARYEFAPDFETGRPLDHGGLGFAIIEHDLIIADLAPGAKVTYFALHRLWRPDKLEATPQIDMLALMRGLRRSAIKDHLAQLVRAGYIERRPRRGRSSVTVRARELPEERFAIVPHLVTFHRDLGDMARVVYARLRWHWRRKPVCFVGVERLAEALNVHTSTIHRCLTELEEAKLLRREERARRVALTWMLPLDERAVEQVRERLLRIEREF
jgi:DNA-binding MarR family transcriptional regulator